MRKPVFYSLALVALLLIAFALRLYRLDYADISGDEAWSVTVASWPLTQVLSGSAETNPPLYHVLLFAMMRAAGTSPFALRYLSVLLGVLALAFTACLGRTVGGRWLAMVVLGAGIFAPFLVYYAQDARMYGPALLGSAGSMAAFSRLVAASETGERPPRYWWLLYALLSLVGVYSHYYAFATLLAQAVYIAGWTIAQQAWRRLPGWLITWGAMAMAFVPWLAVHFAFLGSKASGRFAELTPGMLTQIGQRTLVAYGAGITLPTVDAWHGWLVVGLALFGCVGLLAHPQQRRWGVLLGLTVLGGVLFAWLVNPIMPFFWERYLLGGMPAFLLLLAAGLRTLLRLPRPYGVALALAAALAILAVDATSLQHQFFDPVYVKGNYGRLMADLRSQAQPGDVILLNNPLQDSLYRIYGPETAEMPAVVIDRAQLLTDQTTADQMCNITAAYRRVWLVEMGNPQEYDPEHRAQRWLAQQGSRAYYQNYTNGGLLYLFVLNTATAGQENPVYANLNDQITLVGYRLNQDTFQPGDALLLRLTWQAAASIPHPYTVFTHFVDAEGHIIAQTDGEPVGGARPTQTWQPGETIDDNYAILLPDDITPGTYTVRVGMYLWPALTRLPVRSSDLPVTDNSIELKRVIVTGKE